MNKNKTIFAQKEKQFNFYLKLPFILHDGRLFFRTIACSRSFKSFGYVAIIDVKSLAFR